MQYIYPINKQVSTDHCAECGGEEYEGGCGILHAYLMVRLFNDGTVRYFRKEAICEGCAEGIESLKTMKGQL